MGKLKNKKIIFPIFYFHIKEKTRKKYGIEEGVFKLNGNLVVIDFELANTLIKK